MNSKTCTKCNTTYPATTEYFYKQKASKYGLHSNCKVCRKQYKKQYRQDNKESISQYYQQWCQNNKDHKNQHNIQYQKDRKALDPIYKLSCNIRGLIKDAFNRKGYSKSSKTADILGCSFEDLMIHLEETCKANYGCSIVELEAAGYSWDLDHKVPVSVAETEENLIRLCHYSNLQVLESNQNRHEKRDLIGWTIEDSEIKIIIKS